MRSNAVQYEFVSQDEATIEAAVTNVWETLTGQSVHAASPQKLFIQWVTSIIMQLRANINYAANQNIPSRAEGDNLDALGELFYNIKRPQAKYAHTTIRVTISAVQTSLVLVPSGTRFTSSDGAIVFSTSQDYYVPIGSLYVDVAATCDTAGTSGNGYTAGQINTCVDVFNLYQSCSNITTTDGGTDIATDDEYYEILVASEDSHSTAGAKSSYEYWAKQVSNEIQDVCVNSPTPGVVKIYAMMNDGTIATPEIKSAILAACSADEVRPLTDSVYVEDPDIVSYNIDITYYMAKNDTDRSAAEIATLVADTVDEFNLWQASRIGRDINPSKLIHMLIEAGLKRVEVTSPTFTQLYSGTQDDIDQGHPIPQIAQVNTITITSGGYEDE